MRARFFAASLPILVSITAACSSPPPQETAAIELRDRLRHDVPFVPAESQFEDGASLVVTRILGTRPVLEPGGEYLILGRYSLRSEGGGQVNARLTTHDWRDPGRDTDLAIAPAPTGESDFALLVPMRGPGRLHVELHAGEGSARRRVANLYVDAAD